MKPSPKVREHFGFKAGRIYLLDKGGEILTLAASEGIETKGLEHLGILEGFSGKSARTRSFIAQQVSDLEDQERASVLSRDARHLQELGAGQRPDRSLVKKTASLINRPRNRR